jgi:hypothetical protein
MLVRTRDKGILVETAEEVRGMKKREDCSSVRTDKVCGLRNCENDEETGEH